MKQKLFTLFLALVASVGIIYASDTQVDGIWYDFNESNKTASVTYRGGYPGSWSDTYSGSVVIPSSVTYNGITYSVTSIGNRAFQSCSLKSITIPNSVTSIGNYAFMLCPFIYIAIPNSVTSIGEAAFDYCSKLASVTIGNSVTSIGNYAFSGCSSLTSITIPNGVTSIGSSAFEGCSNITSVTWNAKNCNSYNFGSQVTSFEFGNEVEVVPSSLCKGMEKLTSITIPNSVTSIGSGAFEGCKSLTSPVYNAHCFAYMPISYLGAYTIPDGIKQIAGSAFAECSSLISITIGNSVKSIGEYAFNKCSSLTSVNVDSNNPNYSSVDGVLFNKDKTALIQYPGGKQGAYTIPNSVTSVGNQAFDNCKSLTSITIPNGVTSIGSYAFYGCDKLVDVYCYATTPPATEGEDTFSHNNAFLYVPCESKKAYMVDAVWGNFKYIECIESDNVTTDEIVVTPSENEVEITWPSVSGAATYELVIKDKDGNIVCTLIFNANGQLTSIAFNAPSRNGVPAQTQSAGFSFTITGLDSGTNYDLTLTAKDNSGNTIEETTIPFHTDYPEGIENVPSSSLQGGDRGRLILRDGQVLILRNGKTYTMQGQEVK